MTSKPTICTKCKYHRLYFNEHFCAFGQEERICYVTGHMDKTAMTECVKKNKDGNCPDFEAKEKPPPPPVQPPMREFPVCISAEGYLGPECPFCHSDMKRRWWIFGRLLGCINKDCRNYWARKGVKLPSPWPPPPVQTIDKLLDNLETEGRDTFLKAKGEVDNLESKLDDLNSTLDECNKNREQPK